MSHCMGNCNHLSRLWGLFLRHILLFRDRHLPCWLLLVLVLPSRQRLNLLLCRRHCCRINVLLVLLRWHQRLWLLLLRRCRRRKR